MALDTGQRVLLWTFALAAFLLHYLLCRFNLGVSFGLQHSEVEGALLLELRSLGCFVHHFERRRHLHRIRRCVLDSCSRTSGGSDSYLIRAETIAYCNRSICIEIFVGDVSKIDIRKAFA